MATVIHQQPVFVRPAPVSKKISVKKRSREEIVNRSETMEKYSSEFAAYIKLEAKFLASTSEVSALGTYSWCSSAPTHTHSNTHAPTRTQVLCSR